MFRPAGRVAALVVNSAIHLRLHLVTAAVKSDNLEPRSVSCERRLFRDDGTDNAAWHQSHSNVILCILERKMPTVFQPTADKRQTS